MAGERFGTLDSGIAETVDAMCQRDADEGILRVKAAPVVLGGDLDLMVVAEADRDSAGEAQAKDDVEESKIGAPGGRRADMRTGAALLFRPAPRSYSALCRNPELKLASPQDRG